MSLKLRMQAPLQFVKSDAIIHDYPAFAISDADDTLVTIMQFVEQLFPGHAIVICQRSQQPSVQYASSNCKKVFGYAADEVSKMSLPDFLTLVHEDDNEEVAQCFAFINSLEPYDPLLFRFEFHYRLKHKNGSYISIADEKMAIKNPDGKYIYINAFRDITAEEKLYNVKLNIYQNTNGDIRLVQTYIPRLHQTNLTARQIDIINLVSRGFTNSEIADELSVSVHTIKNHKSIMFRKIKVRNTLELLNAANTLRLN